MGKAITGTLVEERDWYALDVAGETLTYPALPVSIFQEHMSRHREDASEIYETRIGNGDEDVVWTRTATAEGTVDSRDAALTYTVMNRVQDEQDVLKIEGGFPDPELAPADPDSYLRPLWDQRYETMVADMEHLYEQAKVAAYMVPEVQERLNDDARRTDALSQEDVVERAREQALDGYYGDMGMDTLIQPMAWLLEDGHADRDGLLAPFKYALSGNAAERAKVGKGEALIEQYYDVVRDAVKVLAAEE